jgi:hypothetical protein
VNGSVSGGLRDKWCSAAGGVKTLTVDLGKRTAITSVTARHAESGGESRSMNTRDYDIGVSSDGRTFSTVARVRGNTAKATVTKVAASARFVRLSIVTPTQNGGGIARIYEFEVR